MWEARTQGIKRRMLGLSGGGGRESPPALEAAPSDMSQRAHDFGRRRRTPLKDFERPDEPWEEGSLYYELIREQRLSEIGKRRQLDDEVELDELDWSSIDQDEYMSRVSWRLYHPEFLQNLGKVVAEEGGNDDPREPITYMQKDNPICVTQPILNELRQNRIFMAAFEKVKGYWDCNSNDIDRRYRGEKICGGCSVCRRDPSQREWDHYRSLQLHALITKQKMVDEACNVIIMCMGRWQRPRLRKDWEVTEKNPWLKRRDKHYLGLDDILDFLHTNPVMAPSVDLFLSSREAVVKRDGDPYCSLESRVLLRFYGGVWSPQTALYLARMVVPPVYLCLWCPGKHHRGPRRDYEEGVYPDEFEVRGVKYRKDYLKMALKRSWTGGHAFCCVRKKSGRKVTWLQVDNEKVEEVELGHYRPWALDDDHLEDKDSFSFRVDTAIYKAVGDYNPAERALRDPVVSKALARLCTDVARDATLRVDLSAHTESEIRSLVDDCLKRGTALELEGGGLPGGLSEELQRGLRIVTQRRKPVLDRDRDHRPEVWDAVKGKSADGCVRYIDDLKAAHFALSREMFGAVPRLRARVINAITARGEPVAGNERLEQFESAEALMCACLLSVVVASANEPPLVDCAWHCLQIMESCETDDHRGIDSILTDEVKDMIWGHFCEPFHVTLRSEYTTELSERLRQRRDPPPRAEFPDFDAEALRRRPPGPVLLWERPRPRRG